MSDAFWEGLWQGVFELIALGGVAFWVNIVYQRFRTRMSGRQELVDEIDEFTVRLYKPRKIYQRLIDPTDDPLARIPDEAARESRRVELVHAALEEVVEAIGRFRSLQVKMVPLFGYDADLFGFYLAIWNYLKAIRKRMERGESLYFHHESSESVDAFYRLIDSFRYRILIEPFASDPPGLVRPPKDVLERMRARGRAIYDEFFETPATDA